MPRTITLDDEHATVVMRALHYYRGTGVGRETTGHTPELIDETLAGLSHVWRADESVAPGRPVSVACRSERLSQGHVRLLVFVGRTPGSRGLAGTLTVSADEWEALKAAGWEEVP